MNWSVLRSTPFLWSLTRARFAEFDGKFEKARVRLSRRVPPAEYVALRDAYDARLAAIAYAGLVTSDGLSDHPPYDTLRLITALKANRWYRSPDTKDERYAARYVDYLEAVIAPDATRRAALARELQETDAPRLYKQVLLAI